MSWRQTFKDIVAAFVVADFRLDRGVPGVQPTADETARSDLVLHALVSDDAAGISIEVHLVYVP